MLTVLSLYYLKMLTFIGIAYIHRYKPMLCFGLLHLSEFFSSFVILLGSCWEKHFLIYAYKHLYIFYMSYVYLYVFIVYYMNHIFV